MTPEDVWGYIVNQGIDYHQIYDKQGELYGKIGAKENRLVTLYDREFENFGSLIVSQYIYPDKTNRLKKMEREGDAEGI